MKRWMKAWLVWIFIGYAAPVWAQQNFLQQQLQYATVQMAYRNKDSLLKAEFAAKGLNWPPRYLYIRSFKYDSQLEVWVKSNPEDTFRLFKVYRICALSGTMGPKRMQGDYQVPEGFYYINHFNPKSSYHLSLGLNYPNTADLLSIDHSSDPGGDIYIHGSCVSRGCIPLTDSQIEELYLLALYAHSAGQDFIPVHIFPIRFGNPTSEEFLSHFTGINPGAEKLWSTLREAYTYFNETHQLPIIMTDASGQYVMALPPHKHQPELSQITSSRG
ncbi:MAG: L,D-transpeptidase family protein [Thermoflavifilum aggregans]|nr:L,D-transpeptidase family protein [Thermoflavifilum aggregans]